MTKRVDNKNIRHLLFNFRRENWTSFKNFVRSAELGWVFYLAFVFIMAMVLTFEWRPLPSNIEVGSIASRDIRSDQTYNIIDQEATDQLIIQARESIPPVFVFDATLAKKTEARVSDSFSRVREEHKKLQEQVPQKKISPQGIEGLRTIFTDTLGSSLSVTDFQILHELNYPEDFEKALQEIVGMAQKNPIVSSEEDLKPFVEKDITLHSDSADERLLKAKEVKSLKTIDQIKEGLKKITLSKKIARAEPVVRTLAEGLIQTNMEYDGKETTARIDNAVKAVEAVMIRVQPGESIIRRGDRFQARTISIIEGISKAKTKQNFRWQFFGTALIILFFLIVFYVFAGKYIQKFRPKRQDIVFFCTSLLLYFVVLRLSLGIAYAVRDAAPYDLPVSALFLGLPVAGIVMLVRLVRNAEESLIFAVTATLLLSFVHDIQIHHLVYYLIASIVAIGTSARVDTRAALFRSGFFTALSQVFMVLAMTLILSVEIGSEFDWETLAWQSGLAFISGAIAPIIALTFCPFAESLFDYLTNIKLLELGNMNHPLLRELIVRAPGTYHHSHLVGTLAEAGAQSIGANGLFARVAAYFHDVGKMTKSDYFIENTKKGLNRHDGLTPSMSALIIQNHVKDGMELARYYKLPERIIDIIPEHQGTKLIRFFYSKAKEAEGPNASSVDEKDYRYPGPKPQSRESGIILLADAVEAATRSLPDKAPTKIQVVVENMINANFTDGQLDECDLTLRDLHDISESFSRILTAIYHQRIEYPALPNRHNKSARKDAYVDDKYTKPEPIAGSSAKASS